MIRIDVPHGAEATLVRLRFFTDPRPFRDQSLIPWRDRVQGGSSLFRGRVDDDGTVRLTTHRGTVAMPNVELRGRVEVAGDERCVVVGRLLPNPATLWRLGVLVVVLAFFFTQAAGSPGLVGVAFAIAATTVWVAVLLLVDRRQLLGDLRQALSPRSPS